MISYLVVISCFPRLCWFINIYCMVILYRLQLTPVSLHRQYILGHSRSSLILSLILFTQFNGHAGVKILLNVFQVSVVSRRKSSCQHWIEYSKLKQNNYHLRNPRILDVLSCRGWPKLKHSILFWNRSTKISKDMLWSSRRRKSDGFESVWQTLTKDEWAANHLRVIFFSCLDTVLNFYTELT